MFHITDNTKKLSIIFFTTTQHIMKNYYFILLLCLWGMLSCSENQNIPEIDSISEQSEELENINEEDITPSDFDFSTIQEGDTIHIGYNHDLNSKSIELPKNVVFQYNGGSIINGHFIFNEGKIDGRLLNYQLEIEGEATLINSDFTFKKENWSITEGKVSDEIALINKKAIQKAIDDSHLLNATSFNIEKLDAYFNVSYDNYYIAPIDIPSNFVLNMTDNTHIRVQPNGNPSYCLLKLLEVSNVNVIGGNLYGDRDEHDYTPTSNGDTEHAGGYLVVIEGSTNILVNNVTLKNSTADGLAIGCLGTYTDRGLGINYQQSIDITVSNCTFDSNRRNAISPGDGVRITIDSNNFLNSGIDTEKSKGTAPRCAIDVESWWELDENLNLIQYNTTKDFVISNNYERGGANSSFLVAIGENVIIENNDVERGIGFAGARNVTIRNNIVATKIGVGDGVYRPYISNNKVYGNTITKNDTNDEYNEIGILVQCHNTEVYNNVINDKTTGIAIRSCFNSEIYGNTIIPRQDSYVTYGIYGYAGSMNNAIIKENNIKECDYKPICIAYINITEGQEDYTATIENNNFIDCVRNDSNRALVHIEKSNGISGNDVENYGIFE